MTCWSGNTAAISQTNGSCQTKATRSVKCVSMRIASESPTGDVLFAVQVLSNRCKLFNGQYKSCSAAINNNSRITLRGFLLCMSWPSILYAILTPSLRSWGSSCLAMVSKTLLNKSGARVQPCLKPLSVVSKTMLNKSGARVQPYLKPVHPLTMVSSRAAL